MVGMQVLPMEDINLHFTEICMLLQLPTMPFLPCDHHLHQGNELGIDQRRILWKRVVDLNDRALRHVTVGLGGPLNGIPREDGFDITVVSEIMAIFAWQRTSRTETSFGECYGYRYDRTPVSVGDL